MRYGALCAILFALGNPYASEKNYELDRHPAQRLRYCMESNHQITAAGHQTTSEAELELLIAKYTLEYLYRWTNQFDPIQLAQIKHLLDTEGEPKVLLRRVIGPGSALPS
jgi:hypothetical protein